MPTIHNSENRSAADAGFKTSLATSTVPCFTPGTVIATPTGERPVETLEVGDRVLTRDNGLQEIRWMGQCRLSSSDLKSAPHLRPVQIKSGALEHGLPEKDILVSPWHSILIQDKMATSFFDENEVLATASYLTGKAGIDVLDVSDVTYIHFMFDRHEVVLSNGFWTESLRPEDKVLNSLGRRERQQIIDLFPELDTLKGRKAYQSARRALTKQESQLLIR